MFAFFYISLFSFFFLFSLLLSFALRCLLLERLTRRQGLYEDDDVPIENGILPTWQWETKSRATFLENVIVSLCFFFFVGEDGGFDLFLFKIRMENYRGWHFFVLFALFTFTMFNTTVYMDSPLPSQTPSTSTIFTVAATFVPIQNRWTQSLAHNMANGILCLCACGIVNNMRRWCTSTSIYHNHLSHK